MPAFSATRGHLGPGYGQPVQELRPVRLTEGCGKLYNPVSTVSTAHNLFKSLESPLRAPQSYRDYGFCSH